MAMIEVKNLYKTFSTKEAEVEALKNINFRVEAGDVYGIIGMSGAGKSTLVRCLNLLETPTSGSVEVDGISLTQLDDRKLRQLRAQIGMIFQNFNLMMQSTVLANVCFPLKIHGTGGQAAKKKARELLKTVGLEEKASAYPAQLSGGQRQRVAIARALACDPRILLCDEATSALDPQTTQQILALLREINQKTGITIVIITHSMSVVREICNHVAIVEKGELVENGSVEEVFAHPKSDAAKRLIIEGRDPEEWKENRASLVSKTEEKHTGRKVRIVFSRNSSYEPVVANMVLQFGEPVNILKANTKDVQGVARGDMILALSKEGEIADRQIRYLKDHELSVEVLD